ncbi:peptide-N-glycosidase F-related protein [uncultured Psychroserpens sp.]|uniref:peptide-N-glycosidase F-related protein n=1 Tax=uncultured Psychroserpens sp. TaxID=255436 RepID=UPI00262FC9B3|nr:peptide-N-glycosidase F-related protein [uncultured Psychroserpens sp.]
MKINYIRNVLSLMLIVLSLLFIVNCSSDESSSDEVQASSISITGNFLPFGEVNIMSSSASQSVLVRGSNLSSNLEISITENFEISLDDINFTNQLTVSRSDANNADQMLYVRFSPSATAIGVITGTLTLESDSATTQALVLNGLGLDTTPVINVNSLSFNFDDTPVSQQSSTVSLVVNGNNLASGIDINLSEGFEASFDGNTFMNTLQIPSATANDETLVYVRFSPIAVGATTGMLSLANTEASSVDIALNGLGLALVHNYITFNSERLAFGGAYSQTATQTFNLHDDVSNVETIKMYVKLRCPSVGCDEWDVYANVKVKDEASGELYELGRYITPYWNDNSQLDRGFEFDVTDFKSLLTGATELRIRTECWNDRGYEVTVDFDYIEGTPDYPYYAISRVIAYDDWSTSGVPYGINHSFDLDKSVSIPSNSESTHLRTIISGWGHATPNDADGRPCAEWCYRTHDVKINGANMFQHNLSPLGCASNPVNNQDPGNWQPDRAGWCPGMVVPVRTDQFGTSMAGNSFTFEYDYEDWVNNQSNGDAFYATSTFVVVKSNTPINKPVVTE